MATLIQHEQWGQHAQPEDQPPREIVVDADRKDQQADEVGAHLAEDIEEESQADESATVSHIGVLGHDHATGRIVTPDADAKNQPAHQQHREVRGERRHQCPDDHEHGFESVHASATEEIAKSTEHHRA